MANPNILYSVNTWLAGAIAAQYYGGKHYVWCSPIFDSSRDHNMSRMIPPSSSPCDIYKNLKDAVLRGDRHDAKIADNKIGILNGAEAKLTDGIIDSTIRDEIASIVDLSQISDFKPLLYVIPFAKVRKLVQSVPVGAKAHPMSAEYLVKDMPRRHFDILELQV